ncbi:MAG: tyrosine-type recombinase/integrase [Eubacteriales bacterium]|nr:tyrosine-type recombinase/integrase [Eubacteriales bacterium]
MKKANKEACELAGYIYSFLNDYAPNQRTSSNHTLKSYSIALTLYIGFLEEVKQVTPDKLTAEYFGQPVMEEWLNWLRDVRECSPQTCNIRLASIRVFLTYLASRDVKYLHLSNNASHIKARKTMKKHVEGMSRNAVKVITEQPDPATKTGRRDLTFMVLLYATAARMDEMLDMKVSQLHLSADRPYVTLIGKGRKTRNIYLLPKAVAHVQRYLKDFHGSNPNDDDFLFYSRNTGKTGKLSQTAIDKMLKKHAKAARKKCSDVPEKLHAHQFRHAKASHWLEDGMNIVQISFLLGHADVKTTMVYLDITTEAELKAMATLDDEEDKKIPKKWKADCNKLSAFCGLKAMAK